MQNAALTKWSGTLLNINNLFSYIRIGKEILTFGNIETEENKCYHHKAHVPLTDIDIEKVLVTKRISFGGINHKYFIGYLYNDNKFSPLHIILPKISKYVKGYDEQFKWMFFSLKMMIY